MDVGGPAGDSGVQNGSDCRVAVARPAERERIPLGRDNGDRLCGGRTSCSHVAMSELTMSKSDCEAFLADLHVGGAGLV